jgi:hypothetical protein
MNKICSVGRYAIHKKDALIVVLVSKYTPATPTSSIKRCVVLPFQAEMMVPVFTISMDMKKIPVTTDFSL